MDSARPPATPTLTVTFDGFPRDRDEESGTMETQPESSTRTRLGVRNKSGDATSTADSDSERRRRMKLLERYLKQNDSSAIKLAVENLQSFSFTNPLGFQFQVSQDRLKQSKKRGKCSIIFQYMDYLNKKFGLRHVLLILLLLAYSLVGGAIFEAIERPHEIEDLNSLHQALVQKIANFSEEIILLKTNETARLDKIKEMTTAFYKDMLDMEGKLQDSAFDKYDNDQLMWNFGSAVFYATCLFTTIGYGTIVCKTTGGQVFSIIYSTIGIPLILVVLSDLGRVLLFALQRFYNRVYRIFRRTRLCRKVGEKDTVDHSFPLRIAVPLVAIYMLLCAVIVYMFDYRLRGDEDGLTFFQSFYFSFISMTTIGLGDVMPNHIQYSPLVSTLFMFGLVLFSVINSTIYMRMERNYFRAMEAMEEVLEELHTDEVDESIRGHKVFRDMSSALRVAALTMPGVDEERGEVTEGRNLSPVAATIPDCPVPDDGRRTSASSRHSQASIRRHRRRNYSNSSDIYCLTPTLGVLGFNLSPPMREINEVKEPQEAPKQPKQPKLVVTKARAKSRSDTYLVFDRPERITQQYRRSLRLNRSIRRVHPKL